MWFEKITALYLVKPCVVQMSHLMKLCSFQGSGESLGHGPEQHLQEDQTSGRQAGRAVPDPAGDRQRSCKGRQAGCARMPIPVPLSTLELYQPEQVLWQSPPARWACVLIGLINLCLDYGSATSFWGRELWPWDLETCALISACWIQVQERTRTAVVSSLPQCLSSVLNCSLKTIPKLHNHWSATYFSPLKSNKLTWPLQLLGPPQGSSPPFSRWIYLVQLRQLFCLTTAVLMLRCLSLSNILETFFFFSNPIKSWFDT